MRRSSTSRRRDPSIGSLARRAGIDGLRQDLRQAMRAPSRDRRFTAVAILVLALGIGGNATVFSLVNALLLNPFPYPDAGRLVEIESRSGDGSWLSTVRVGDFGYWRRRATYLPARRAVAVDPLVCLRAE